MRKEILVILGGCVLAVSLTGCATTRVKQNELELQALRSKAAILETQLQEKDDEINSLKDALAQVQLAPASQVYSDAQIASGVDVSAAKQPKLKQIQIALKNSGYYSGPVDGRKGRRTRQAIRDFQRANNLSVDGKCGPMTWVLLKEYLDKKIK